LSAICDDVNDPMGRQLGEALWPDQRPAAWLEQFMVNVLTWTSMYQGSPRPLGDALFNDATYYDDLPEGGYRVGYGADLAYSEKTRADWSCLLGARRYKNDIYLTSMLRKQMQADRFTALMQARVEHERGPVLWFGGGQERGVAQLIREKVPTFRFAMASADKYVRALPTAEKLWNPGRILVPNPERFPAHRHWVEEFIHEIAMFTGMKDPQDDQVDALAALGALFLRGFGSGSGVDPLNKGLLASVKPHIRLVA
jgi:predicted phage terminase large subunit-like protein